MIPKDPQPIPQPWSKRASLTPRKTYSRNSKIVYKRRIRTFKPSDVARIVDKVDSRKYEDRVDKDFPLFTKILNWAAEAMLSRILGALGLDSDAASIFWSAINIIWLKFVEIVEPNNYARRIQIAYKARLEEAIRQYTRNGKTALLEKLAKDMAGIK